MKYTFRRQNEEFVIGFNDETTTVTDENGTIVTIQYSCGRFDIQLPSGLGARAETMKQAVDNAVRLCIDYRKNITKDEALKQMRDFVEQCCDSTTNPDRFMPKIEIPESHYILTGEHAIAFRDIFVKKIYGKENPQGAHELANADKFTIVVEITDDGAPDYQVETGHLGESIVAVGPNFLLRSVRSSQDSFLP